METVKYIIAVALCLVVSASLPAQTSLVTYSSDSLSAQLKVSKADYATNNEYVWTLKLPQNSSVKVTRINNGHLTNYSGTLLIDAVDEILHSSSLGEYSTIITGRNELNFVLQCSGTLVNYEPVIVIKFAKISNNESSETMVYGGDLELEKGILRAYGHENFKGSKIAAILGKDYASYTCFGAVNGGRIRGSNEGYLILEGNPNGYGNPTIFLNRYVSNGNVIMTSPGGKVGIGVDVPEAKLHVNGTVRASGDFLGYTRLAFQDHTRFTVTPSTIPDLPVPFSMPHYGIATPNVGGSADLWLSGNHGVNLFANGSPVPRLSINQLGNVGIGTVNPQYLLDVKGIIRATEVKVESVDNFPDYVFKENYSLRPLTDVNAFIQTHGHLPEMPSAQEVKENGMSLVEMNKKLLLKVEELTLYIIDQQRQIDALKAKK